MQNSFTERLGVHQVGRAFSKAGMIFRELPTSDEGIDAQVELSGPNGRGSGRLIALQIKAGESWFREATDEHFTFRFSQQHYEFWTRHSLPVIVVFCDLGDEICYWQRITEDTCISTGKDWKLYVPKIQQVTAQLPFEDLASPITAASDFTTASTTDVSHGLARRLSIDVVAHSANQTLSKVKLASVVRSALKKAKTSDYFRDEISRNAHIGKAPEMVSGFVYLREVDRAAAQWVCRFQWTSESISEAARYEGVPGTVDSDGLVIEWKLDRTFSLMLDERRLDKGDYLSRVDSLSERAEGFQKQLEEFHKAPSAQRSTERIITRSKEFEQSWDDRNAPPPECLRLDQTVGELLATVGNFQFLWSGHYDKKNAEFQSRRAEAELKRIIGDLSFLRRDVR